MKPRFVSFLPALVWFIFSVILLVMPGSDIPKGPMFDIPHSDKFVHVFLFGFLNFLICLPYLKVTDTSRQFFFITAFSVLCYGVAMEFVQKYFCVNRNFDVMDMVADGSGSFIAYFIVLNLFKKYNKNEASVG